MHIYDLANWSPIGKITGSSNVIKIWAEPPADPIGMGIPKNLFWKPIGRVIKNWAEPPADPIGKDIFFDKVGRVSLRFFFTFTV